MESFRKWFYKPKKDDTSLLAQFFFADEALLFVASELDSFDGRKDPERCTMLVNHLRLCQDRVLTICNRIMDEIIPGERANRDFRVKFPDDVMQENLAGQLWFGAECLAAGSSIMNREIESSSMRPLAKALTRSLQNVRNQLREQCFRSKGRPPPDLASVIETPSGEHLCESLRIFDKLFAEFELCYVSAMVPVKSASEYELQQAIVVLFSETLQRALKMRLLTQEMVDDYDPALMFTIPRLAIVSGLLIFPDGPLCIDRPFGEMSEMFRPFRNLLHQIRELLWTLNKRELYTLEKLLCHSEEPADYLSHPSGGLNGNGALDPYPDMDDFITQFYNDYPNCKQFISDFYSSSGIMPAEGREAGEDEEDTVTDATEAWANEEGTGDWDSPILNMRESDEEEDNDDSDVNEDSTPREGFSRRKGSDNSTSQTVNIPTSAKSHSSSSSNSSVKVVTGYRMANQVSMNALVAASSNYSLVNAPESLPESDAQEEMVARHAMHAVQASLSNLLLSNNCSRESSSSSETHSPSPSLSGSEAPVIAHGDGQLPHSPPDSGVAASDSASLSDRSPDGQSATQEENIAGDCVPSSSVRQLDENPVWSLPIIPCSCDSTLLTSSAQEVSPRTSENSSAPNELISRPSGEVMRGEVREDDCKKGKKRIGLVSVTGVDDDVEWVGGQVLGEGQCSVCSGSSESAAQSNRSRPSAEMTWSRAAASLRKKSLNGRKSRGVKGSSRIPEKSESPMISSMGNSGNVVRSLAVPLPTHIQELGGSYSSSCSSRRSTASTDSDTSSYNSECQDDEEIALAMQAAEIANRNEARAKFRSSEDLVHRLFVYVAGVADQLQTNFAGDLRNILKCVFLVNSSPIVPQEEEEKKGEKTPSEGNGSESGPGNQECNGEVTNHGERVSDNVIEELSGESVEEHTRSRPPNGIHVENAEEALLSSMPSSSVNGLDEGENMESRTVELPPPWVPDEMAPRCMSCEAVFTVVRRRHHCRNCGKVFCARCSSNSVPLPRYGHVKPVRVCNRCFMYQVTPFTIEEIPSRS
ncbi:lateral signaling target protein 2 homolog isoform X2 [Ischnura elegans]|uniref:lateral signaling target protein 2 homolog isoform X2 n=1 Tax=Ischnura elegans TaxID=197161 RepID=UPI001ED8B0A9|nr:lateral signaling target protein 2 homolog isoform X2 [Ischnura elegans]